VKEPTIHKPSFAIIGIACRTSNDPQAAPRDIPQLWARFFSENIVGQIPNKVSKDVIALYSDYESDYTKPYSLIIGCQATTIDVIPMGMVGKIIPASSYVLFRAVGEHPQALVDTRGKIWQTDIKRSYTGDYELYGDAFVSGSPKEVEIYIAVEENKKEPVTKEGNRLL
jgi:predicted transcriptional regulator YdeE